MKLEVIEGDNRIKGLDKLKNEEEYTEAKRNFDYYMSEYEWVSNSKNPKGEIEDELRECNKELHADMEQDEERNLLSKIQTLKTKYIQVARGEYAANLKGNISALLLMLEQYEASNEKRNFSDLTKGIFKGDPDTKEYLKKKYMLSWSNMYGVTKAPESLNVEPMEDILDYMAKNYDLVDIDLSDRKDGKEEEQFYRLDRIRAGGCGKCSRAGEHLEIPVSGSKRWRRSVYSVLCGTGTYLWVYVADNRDRDRT